MRELKLSKNTVKKHLNKMRNATRDDPDGLLKLEDPGLKKTTPAHDEATSISSSHRVEQQGDKRSCRWCHPFPNPCEAKRTVPDP